MSGVRVLAAGLMLILPLAIPCAVRAQGIRNPKTQAEVRGDAILDGARTALQLGAGIQVSAGIYTRIGIVGAIGSDVSVQGTSSRQLNGRVDLVARFLFDPFRQTAWGFSAGGGVSLRARANETVRPFLLTVIELEGPRGERGIAPSVQLGLGGGVRIGAALRWGERQAR